MKMTRELFRQNDDLNARVQLRGRWVHEFGDDKSSVDAHFATNPSLTFEVGDEDIARDSAVLGAGFGANLSQRTSFLVNYDTKLSADETNHLISASLLYRY